MRRDDISSSWCYAASLSPIIDDDDDSTTTSTTTLPTGSNFLATQVWPSSRIASTVIEKYMNPSWSVCELGCGPGLPSLTAACCGARKVIATDVDDVALELVKAAAIEQGYIRKENSDNDTKDAIKTNQLDTRGFDLTSEDDILPRADLYILSDVFESSSVAEGAAYHVKSILSNNKQRTKEQVSRVWVFAQQDRAQRDTFLNQMREWYCNEDKVIDWSMNHKPDPNEELWLFDLDETMVGYN